MTKCKILFSTFILSFLSVAANAYHEGTAGARGGGTGIQCAGNAAPIMLEEYALKSSTLPEARNDVKTWLDAKLKDQPELLNQIEIQWNSLGEFSSWSVHSDATDSESELSIFLREMTDTFQSLGQNWSLKIEKFDPNSTTSSALIHDDFSTIPSTCQKLQLSEIEDGKVYRLYSGDLSLRTQRYLELHEAIYLVGMENYAQTLPNETRSLIIAMSAGSKKEIKKAVRSFISTPKSDERSVSAFDKILILKAAGIGAVEDSAHACPLSLSMAYDGSEFDVVSLELEGNLSAYNSDSAVSIVPVTRLAKGIPKPSIFGRLADAFSNNPNAMTLDRHPALYFVDGDERPFYRGYDKVLVQYTQYTYRLYAGDPDSMNSFLNTHLPKAGGDSVPGVIEDCTYSVWAPGASDDMGSSIKTWNQILLNHK